MSWSKDYFLKSSLHIKIQFFGSLIPSPSSFILYWFNLFQKKDEKKDDK